MLYFFKQIIAGLLTLPEVFFETLTFSIRRFEYREIVISPGYLIRIPRSRRNSSGSFGFGDDPISVPLASLAVLIDRLSELTRGDVDEFQTQCGRIAFHVARQEQYVLISSRTKYGSRDEIRCTLDRAREIVAEYETLVSDIK